MSEPSTAAAPPAPATAPGTRHPAVLALGSALALWLAFPPADWGWLGWVALVPLFLLVESPRSRWSVYLGSWVGCLAFWLLAVNWVRHTDPTAWFAWLAMATGLSVFWPLFLLIARTGMKQLRLPLMLAAPIAWVATEYVRAYYVTGFPWYYLAHTQHAVLPVIQIADVTGSLGVSLLLAVVNAWLVDLLTLPLLRPGPNGPRLTLRQAVRLGSVVVMVAGTLGYGTFRLATASFRPGPRLALLQSNLPQGLKFEHEPQKLLDGYKALVDRAAEAAERPDLIVWPETSYPFPYALIEPGLPSGELDRQARAIVSSFTGEVWKNRADQIARHLTGWTDQLGVPMLVGVLTHVHRPEGHAKYNAALLFTPKSTQPQVYYKAHLVPFGEYIPLIETFPWLTIFTPYQGPNVPSLNRGAGPGWLDLGPYRLAVAVCFEDTVPQVVRRFFAEAPGGRSPDVLVNISNDGWFAESAEHEMHLAVSKFRCVEHRVPLARSANTGVSAVVDANGRVLKELGTAKEGVVAGVVPLDDRTSLYTAWGDWLGQTCLAVSIGLFPLAVWRRRNR